MVASIRRRLAVIMGAQSVAVAIAVTTLATGVGAAGLPARYCPLSRVPSLTAAPLGRGDDCSLDQDGNGLDDAVETDLAACFVPTVAFDSAENALASSDPHVVFSARLVGANVIRFRYVFLFTRDTGYVLGTTFPCLKYDHNGDLQTVEVDVTWLERDQQWFGALLAVHAITVDPSWNTLSISGPASDRPVMSDTHPVLYSTAGKHHWSFREASFVYGCNCGPFGRCGSVHERSDGRGPRITPSSVQHAPGFYMQPADGVGVDAGVRLRPQSPIIRNTGRFSNTCEFVTRGRVVPTTGALSTNDLDGFGYAGEKLYGSCFRGGLGGTCATGSVAQELAWGAPFGSYTNQGKLRTWLRENGERFQSAGSAVRRFDALFVGTDSLIPVGLEAFPGLSQLIGKFRGDADYRLWAPSPEDVEPRP